MNSDQQVIEAKPEAVTADAIQATKVVRRPFWKSPKFIFRLVLLLVVIGGIVWLVSAFNTYRNASKYKEAYDIVQEQILYCDKVENEKQEKKIFDYCDEFKSRFRSVEREEEAK